MIVTLSKITIKIFENLQLDRYIELKDRAKKTTASRGPSKFQCEKHKKI